MSQTASGDQEQYDRGELAAMVAAECDRLAEKWWYDREHHRWALEHDPGWREPAFWLRESRPPIRACGAALARLLTRYEPGESVPLVEYLEWCHDRHMAHHDAGDRRLSYGFYRASDAVREGTGLGYPNPDPVIGELTP